MVTVTPVPKLSRLPTRMPPTLKVLSTPTQTPEMRSYRIPFRPVMWLRQIARVPRIPTIQPIIGTPLVLATFLPIVRERPRTKRTPLNTFITTLLPKILLPVRVVTIPCPKKQIL